MLPLGTGPVISNQPVSLTKAPGESATFTVTASGSSPLTYQWRNGPSDISGATSASYTIPSVTTDDAGSYYCDVGSPCGSVTSDAATLSVNGSPVINTHPQSQTKCAGDSVTFSVTASGAGTLTYQWRKENVDISGATGSSYTINRTRPRGEL